MATLRWKALTIAPILDLSRLIIYVGGEGGGLENNKMNLGHQLTS